VVLHRQSLAGRTNDDASTHAQRHAVATAPDGAGDRFLVVQDLASAYELGLFEQLSGTSGTTAGELADRLGIASRPAEMLLTGCAALGLLQEQDGRYANSPLSDEYLVPGEPNHFGGLVMFDRRLYAGWDKLTQAIRTDRPTTWDPDRERSMFESADPEVLATFWEAMHALSTLTGRALGEAFDLGGFRRLLDVGGGAAAFDIVLCQRYPELRATVYDLEFVADIAAGNVKDAGLTDRIAVTPGDFFADAGFPGGHDLHLFSMIMHDWNEVRDRLLLRKSFEALDSGGAVLICELLVDDHKAGPVPAALMSLNMLVECARRQRRGDGPQALSWSRRLVEPDRQERSELGLDDLGDCGEVERRRDGDDPQPAPPGARHDVLGQQPIPRHPIGLGALRVTHRREEDTRALQSRQLVLDELVGRHQEHRLLRRVEERGHQLRTQPPALGHHRPIAGQPGQIVDDHLETIDVLEARLLGELPGRRRHPRLVEARIGEPTRRLGTVREPIGLGHSPRQVRPRVVVIVRVVDEAVAHREDPSH
jgi:hypothetical protein